MTNKTQDTRAIDAYNFMDFVILSEKAREDGYVFDFTTNQTAPANLGFRYFAVMKKGTKSILPEDTKPEKAPKKTEEKTEDKTPVAQKQPEVKEVAAEEVVVEAPVVEVKADKQRSAKKTS